MRERRWRITHPVPGADFGRESIWKDEKIGQPVRAMLTLVQ